MKLLVLCCIMLANFSLVTVAEAGEKPELSIVKSIDDFDLPPAYNDPSEICLPDDVKALDNYTVISDAKARDLFNTLAKNPKARNKIAGGKCAIRRSYIQKLLKSQGISSGRLLINCPSKRGHMRLIDQVTGRRYTFANFHDVNLLSVQGTGYTVFDVQFEDQPMSLRSYLAVVEASQKLKPLNNRTSRDKGYCYWSIK